jgi:Xaa-Pro dipeptidase
MVGFTVCFLNRRFKLTVDRVRRLQEQAAAADLDVTAVIPGPNMIYLTGLSFHLSERPVVAFFPREGVPTLVAPGLEATKARTVPFECRLYTYDDVSGPAAAFNQAAAEMGLAEQRLGVEGRRMRFLELDLIERSVDTSPQITNADAVFAQLRMRKDTAEVEAMRQAVAIAQQAMAATLPTIRPGATEKAIASGLTLQLLRAGAEPVLPFAPLVVAGPNGANPHGFPSERVLQPGDLVTIDWGAKTNHYFSDITRTYAVGGASLAPKLKQAYEAVQAANAAGRAAAKPGATGQEVDRAARQVIVDAGLGEYFMHRTGHGLGLEVHEEPDMKEGNLIPLEPGMTFTIEPGVYIPDLGGVRIEDDVVITDDGAESLTTLPRELTTVG